MSLSKEEVEHIANLARLYLSDDEKERYRQQLSSILQHVARLQDLDTSAVSALSSILVERSRLREDEPGESLSQQALLENAPKTEAGQFRVPPVLDNDAD